MSVAPRPMYEGGTFFIGGRELVLQVDSKEEHEPQDPQDDDANEEGDDQNGQGDRHEPEHGNEGDREHCQVRPAALVPDPSDGDRPVPLSDHLVDGPEGKVAEQQVDERALPDGQVPKLDVV